MSSKNSYLSIADILATEERLPCKIETTIPRIGFLDPASDTPDLKVGTKLELPIWLVNRLSSSRISACSVDSPKYFKESYREILEADPCAVELGKWNQHFYELGLYVQTLNTRDAEKIPDYLLQCFRSRFRLIMDWAQNPVSDPTIGGQLPTLEKQLFTAGRLAKVQLVDWLKQGAGSIETSGVVANIQKTKAFKF